MFYIKEIYLRLIYVTLLIFCLFFIYYQYREITLIIFLIPSKLMGYNLIENFIYTNPAELLCSLLNLNFFLIFIFSTPYVFWLILDFLKPSLLLNEYKNLKYYNKNFSLYTILLNVILFILFFPLIFNFFQSFNAFDLKNLDIKLELRIIEFVYFIYNIFYIINMGLVFISIIIITILFNGISFYIYYKKFFIVFNLIAATIFSTPDIGSQITLFIILNLFLELFQFIHIYKNKINKASY